MLQLNALDKLARLIENCIFDSRQFAQHPRLVAIASFYGFIPFEEIWVTFPNIGQKIPSTNDIEMMINACRMSRTLSRFLVINGVAGKSGVFLPFQISMKELILTSVPKKCSKERLKAFIADICGTNDFELEKIKPQSGNENKRSFIVTFCSLEMVLFLWRALKYAPIEGESYLGAEANIVKPLNNVYSNDNTNMMNNTNNNTNTNIQQETKNNNKKNYNENSNESNNKGKFYYCNNNIRSNNNNFRNRKNNNYTYTPDNNRNNNSKGRFNYVRNSNDSGNERSAQIVVNITRRKEYQKAAPSLKISIERAPRLVIEK